MKLIANRASQEVNFDYLCSKQIHLWQNWRWETISIPQTKYQSRQSPNGKVFFLGAMYSFWGNAIYNISSCIYGLASHIIYAAKCGTLESAASIEKIVVPHLFAKVIEPDDST
jgi:hypothetical protein